MGSNLAKYVPITFLSPNKPESLSSNCQPNKLAPVINCMYPSIVTIKSAINNDMNRYLKKFLLLLAK